MATNKPVTRAFNKLSAVYDVLENADVREDLTTAGYPETEVNTILDGINQLLTDLEDILPGLEMNRTTEGE